MRDILRKYNQYYYDDVIYMIMSRSYMTLFNYASPLNLNSIHNTEHDPLTIATILEQ